MDTGKKLLRGLSLSLLLLLIAVSAYSLFTPSAQATSSDTHYWVGGSGNWNDTAHWSHASGGASGAPVPGSANNVVFDNASDSGAGFTVTINASASCADWTSSGVDQIMGIAGSSTLAVYGSLAWKADHNRTYTGAITFAATAAGKTVDFAGITLSSAVTFNGVGGSWQLNNLLNTTAGTITLTNGTLNTNGQAVTTTGTITGATGTNALTLGASIVTFGTWTATDIDSLTAGTSSLVQTGNTTFTGAGLSYYDWTCNVAGNAVTINGSNTFHNVTRNGTAVATDRLDFQGGTTQTITGTLTALGNSIVNRLILGSSTTSIATLNVATATIATVNFVSIDYLTVTGAAAPLDLFNPLSCLDNINSLTVAYNRTWDLNISGIYLFPADSYWVGAGGNWTDDAGGSGGHWAASPGGAPNANYLPGYNTNVHFDANSGFILANRTIDFNESSASAVICFNDVDFTGAPNSPIWTIDDSQGITVYCYGDFTGISSATFTTQNDLVAPEFNFANLFGSGTNTVSLNGMKHTSSTPNYPLNINIRGNINWGSEFYPYTVGTRGGTFTLYSGTLNTSGFNTYLYGAFVADVTGTKALTLGSTTLTCWTFTNNSTTASFTISAGTSSIVIQGSPTTTADFTGGSGYTYYDINMNNSWVTTVFTSETANSQSKWYGANTFHNFTYTGYANRYTTLDLDNNQVITGTLNITGDSDVNRILVRSSARDSQRTINVTGSYSIDHTEWMDIAAAGVLTPWNLTGGDNGTMGNVAYISFPTPNTHYWVGNTGNWSDISHWASAPGGVGGTSVTIPLCQDTARFDASSITLASKTITVDMPRVGIITTTGVLNNPAIYSAGTINVWGALTLGGQTWNTVSGTYFYNHTDSNMAFAGSTITGNLTIDTLTQSIYLTDAMIVTGDITLLSGYFVTNSKQVTAATFTSSTTTYTRSIDLGASVFVLNSTAAVTKWNVAAANFTFVAAPTSTIYLTSSGANAQTFAGASLTYGHITITGTGNYTLTLTGSNTFQDFTIDRASAPKTVKFTNSTTTTVTNFYCPTVGVSVVTIANTSGVTTWALVKSAGTVSVDYMTINYSAASGGANFYAGTHSTLTGCSGWNASAPALPTVTTGTAINLANTSATIQGNLTVTGGFLPVYLYFHYGTDATLVSYTATSPKSSSSIVTSFSFGLTGLTANTIYYYRAYASDGVSDLAYGTIETFTTTGAATVQTIGSSVDYDALTARIDGVLVDLGIYSGTGVVYFQWGKTVGLGNETVRENATTSYPYAFNANLTSLAKDTTYYFRAVVQYDGTRTAYGSTLSFTTTVSAHTTQPTAILAPDIIVDRNLLTDSLVTYDQIYLVHYDIQYDVYPTDHTVAETYIFQLLDTGGNLLGSQIAFPYMNRGYGQGVVAFYFAAGSAPTWGGKYTVRITGNPTIFTGTLPSEDFVLDTANYTTLSAHDDTQAYLCTSILDISADLENEWGISLTSQQDVGEVLSDYGEKYYRGAIPNISALAPCLFFMQDAGVDPNGRTWNDTLSQTWKARINGFAWLKTGFEGVADLFNIPLMLLEGILMIIACVYVIKKSVEKWQTAYPGYLASIFIIFGFGMLFLGFTIIALSTLALCIVAGWLLFLRRA